MLFPIESDEFWRQIKGLVEEVIDQKVSSKSSSIISGELTDTSLLKMIEVYEIFQA